MTMAIDGIIIDFDSAMLSNITGSSLYFYITAGVKKKKKYSKMIITIYRVFINEIFDFLNVYRSITKHNINVKNV